MLSLTAKGTPNSGRPAEPFGVERRSFGKQLFGRDARDPDRRIYRLGRGGAHENRFGDGFHTPSPLGITFAQCGDRMDGNVQGGSPDARARR